MAALYANENFPIQVLHRRSAAHAGLILCSRDPDVQGQAERIHRAIQKAGDLQGQELRVNRPEK